MYQKHESRKVVIERAIIVIILCLTIYLSALNLKIKYEDSNLVINILTVVALWALLVLTYLRTKRGEVVKSFHLRGAKLISFKEATHKATALTKNNKSIFWGFLSLPINIATSHFAVVGATGSGKTLCLRLLLQSILPEIKKGTKTRAIIYDAKQDILPLLAGICPEVPVYTLNPFDKRSVAWDMAKDITTPASCSQLASALIPTNPKDVNKYFDNTARHLLSGVLITFNKVAKGNWTLRDVMLAIKDTKRLKQILSITELTRDRLQHFENEKTLADVLSTFTTNMQEYESVASAWYYAEKKISLKDWLNDESILVLGNTEVAKRATDEINRVIFRRMSELILSREETTEYKTWIILDEIRQAGRLDSLNLLLTKGRSKGACCVLGFQDIEGMRTVYGREEANELVGQCANKMILKLNSPETASWASSLFGESEIVEDKRSDNQSKHSIFNGSTSNSSERTKRGAVLSSEILNLPITNRENGFNAFSIVPTVGSYLANVSFNSVIESLIEPSPHIQGLEIREEIEQELKDWVREDLERLNIILLKNGEIKNNDCTVNRNQITRSKI